MKTNRPKLLTGKQIKNRKNISHNVLELIGNTPLVKLEKISKNGASILAKLESMNPGGSLKDRVALKIVEDAENKGVLGPGSTLIEASTGNTAVSLAMVAAAKGYPLVLVVPETLGLERRNFLESLGAEIILTAGADGMRGAVKKVTQLPPYASNSIGYMRAHKFSLVWLGHTVDDQELIEAT